MDICFRCWLRRGQPFALLAISLSQWTDTLQTAPPARPRSESNVIFLWETDPLRSQLGGGTCPDPPWLRRAPSSPAHRRTETKNGSAIGVVNKHCADAERISSPPHRKLGSPSDLSPGLCSRDGARRRHTSSPRTHERIRRRRPLFGRKRRSIGVSEIPARNSGFS